MDARQRRRTQVRCNQRAYRLRKEVRITSLTKHVQELEAVKDEMSKGLAVLFQSASMQGLLQREKEFSQRIQSAIKRFQALEMMSTEEGHEEEEPLKSQEEDQFRDALRRRREGRNRKLKVQDNLISLDGSHSSQFVNMIRLPAAQRKVEKRRASTKIYLLGDSNIPRPVMSDEDLSLSFLLENLSNSILSPWLRLHAADTSSYTAQTSIRALAAVYFGRRHRQQNALKKGAILYGQALRHLNKDLQDREKAQSVSVLASASALELYEVMYKLQVQALRLTSDLQKLILFGSESGWLTHAGGVGRLIELRGPRKHQIGYERQILEGIRGTIALECLLKRKRCFLERREWKTTPWAADPKLKSPFLCLHDLLCDLPGLILDAEEIAILGPSEQSERLMKRFSIYLEEMDCWRTSWDRENPAVCWEAPPQAHPGSDPFFTTALIYSSFAHAHSITLYNAMLLVVLKIGSRILETVYKSSLALDITASPLRTLLVLLRRLPDPRAIATDICRSVGYMLQHGCSFHVTFCLSFPLKIAYLAFERDEACKRWLNGVTGEIADASGLEVIRRAGHIPL